MRRMILERRLFAMSMLKILLFDNWVISLSKQGRRKEEGQGWVKMVNAKEK